MAICCAGLTRKGTRCSFTNASGLAGGKERLMADPLRLGGMYCRFHAQPFVAQGLLHFEVPALLFFLNLETTGVDVASDQIVELAC